MSIQTKIEEYDEHTTRVFYKDPKELKRYHKTVDRVVFIDNPDVNEVWHIVVIARPTSPAPATDDGKPTT